MPWERIVVFTGAGVSQRNFRAEDLATPQAFARDPALVWERRAQRDRVVKTHSRCHAERDALQRERTRNASAAHLRASQLIRDADLLLVIGTSGIVYPAAGLVSLCRGTTIEINQAAAETIPRIVEVLR